MPLAVAERDELSRIVPSLTIEPAPGEEGAYNLTPGSYIGAFESGGLSVSIRPKLTIARLLFLASYAMGAFKLRDMGRFDFAEARTLVEALALALAGAARRAFAGGLVHGYRLEEEAAHTVRGRIRMNDQIRRRFGVPLPIEVRYDEFTDDVTANRLVKAAAVRLGRMRLDSIRSREGLHWIAARLENVSLVEFPTHAVPEVTFDRLNEHYQEVVALARLILLYGSVEAVRGRIRAQGFPGRHEQGVSGISSPGRYVRRLDYRGARSAPTAVSATIRGIYLDDDGTDPLSGLTSRGGKNGTCTFVGDAKYKRIADARVPNADLYQLLAYATALDSARWVAHLCDKGRPSRAEYRGAARRQTPAGRGARSVRQPRRTARATSASWPTRFARCASEARNGR